MIQGKASVIGGHRLEKNELLLELEKAHKLLSDKYAQYQKIDIGDIYYNDNCTKNDNLE
jgi:hypothetical protein